ncbi:MAG: phosphodiesterase, partial [Oscillochloris sp.]|nr:phosphodiesterase [Oscillochloris sp.]
VADSRAVRFPRLWEIAWGCRLACGDRRVPGTYPPVALHGQQVSCFLAPNVNAGYTHPPELAARIRDWVAPLADQPYLLDVPDFRSNDKERILRDIYTLCDQRFAVAGALLREEQPDMLMMVEMGVDRIHHAFWRYMDPTSPLYEPGSPFADAIRDYYRHVDGHIGALLAEIDAETLVLVVSDHGARPLMGGFCINEWLIQQGFLHLTQQPAGPTALDQAAVDWSRTKAWGAGGYYARIFLNVAGREPEGIVAPAEFAPIREELAAALRALRGPDGALLGNQVFVPQEIYRRVRGIAPDLILYPGDLAWRAVGKVGMNELFTSENDTGPDDANHAQHGLFIWHDPQRPGNGQQLHSASLYDMLPSLLDRFGIAAPEGLRGRVLAFA